MRTVPAIVLALAAAAGGFRSVRAAEPARAQPSTALRGKVLESVDSGSYTYLRLATATGEIWAAVPRVALAPGAEVAVARPMQMDGFESKTLKRTFDRIVFGTLEGKQQEGEAVVSMPIDATHAGVIKTLRGAAPAVRLDGKVERAAGPSGHTVAEIFASKAALEGTRVSVRGKVVKSSAGILGRTWLHLQDGSGGAGDGDLTVTTQQEVAAGEVVQVSGVVHLSRDFGAGYRYAVLIEDAIVSR